MRRLDQFWLHSNCPVKVKLIAADAVLRAKLLYGLDSAQLGEGELKRMEIMQLKILRKFLGMKTAYVDRDNTNENIYRQAADKSTTYTKKT